MSNTLFTEIYTNVWGYKDAGYENGGTLSGTYPIQSGGNIYGYIGAIFVPENGETLSTNIDTTSPYNTIATNKIVVHLCINDGHPYLGLSQITIKNANHSDIAITNITSLHANIGTATNILKASASDTPAVIKQPAPLTTRNTNNYVFIATIDNTETWPYSTGATNAAATYVSLSFNPGHKLQVAGSAYVSNNMDVGDNITSKYIKTSADAQFSGTFKVKNSSGTDIVRYPTAGSSGVSILDKLTVSSLTAPTSQIADLGNLKVDNYSAGGVSGVDLFVSRAGTNGYDASAGTKFAIRISETDAAEAAANSVSIGKTLTVLDTASFTKASGLGLAVTSDATVAGSITVGTTKTLLLEGDGTSTRITSSDGTVNFGDDNLLTTGNLTGSLVYGNVNGASQDLGAQIHTINQSLGGGGNLGARVTANENFKKEFDNREHGWNIGNSRYRFPGENLTSAASSGTGHTVSGSFPDKSKVWYATASSNSTDAYKAGVADVNAWESGTSNYNNSGVGQTAWNGTTYAGEALTYQVPLVKQNGILVNKMCISYLNGVVTANKHAKKFVLIGHDDNNSKAIDSDGSLGPTSGVRQVLYDGAGSDQLPSGYNDAYDTVITYDITYPRPFKYLTLVVTETGGATSVSIAQLFFFYEPTGYGETSTDESGTYTKSLTGNFSATQLAQTNENVHLGNSNSQNGTSASVSIGGGTTYAQSNGAAFGYNVHGQAYGLALGRDVTASGDTVSHGIGIGRNISVAASTSWDQIAIGTNITGSGMRDFIAIGNNWNFGQYKEACVLMGYDPIPVGSSSFEFIANTIIGDAPQIRMAANCNRATSVGFYNEIGHHSTVVGSEARAAQYAAALGHKAKAGDTSNDSNGGYYSAAIGAYALTGKIHTSTTSKQGQYAFGFTERAGANTASDTTNAYVFGYAESVPSTSGGANIVTFSKLGGVQAKAGLVLDKDTAIASASATIQIGTTPTTVLTLAQNVATVTGQIKQTHGVIDLAPNGTVTSTGAGIVGIGDLAIATGIGSVVIGYGAKSTNQYAVAIGQQAEVSVSGGEGVAIGIRAKVTNNASTAVGCDAFTSGNQGSAFGTDAEAIGDYANAIGTDCKATGNYSIAAGSSSQTTTTNSTNCLAIGRRCRTYKAGQVAIGSFACASDLVGQTIIGSAPYDGSYKCTNTTDAVVFGYSATHNSGFVSNQVEVLSISTTGTLKAADNLILDKSTSSGATATIGTGSTATLLTLADTGVTVTGKTTTTTLSLGGTDITATGVEINLLDGATSATSTTLADADRIIVNDNGTMKQVALSDLNTYVEGAIETLAELTSAGKTTVPTNFLGPVTAAEGLAITGTLTLGGTAIAATAAEINLLDGATSATSTTLADADRIIVNDNGTMKQVALSDLETYVEGAIDTLAELTSAGTAGAATAFAGSMTVAQGLTVTGSISGSAGLLLDSGSGGSATIGLGGDTDLLTLTSGNLHINGTLSFEGSTANGFETTLAVTDPTADRTITFPDAAGTVCVAGGAGLTLSAAGSMSVDAVQADITTLAGVTALGATGVPTVMAGPVDMSEGLDITGNLFMKTGTIAFEGATDDAHETTLTVTDPTADRTITFPDKTGFALVSPVDYTFPASDGTANYFLQTNGSGALAWAQVDLSTKLSLAGGTMTGNLVMSNSATIAMGGAAITGLADPTNAQDAATKAFVAAQITSSTFDGNLTATVLKIDSGTSSGAGGTIGTGSDADLMTLADNLVTVAGGITLTGTLTLGGTAIAATAAEINLLDGATSATSTTLVDADRIIVNDNGTMKQVALSDLETYVEGAIDTLANLTSVGTSGVTTAFLGPVTIAEGLTVTGQATQTSTKIEFGPVSPAYTPTHATGIIIGSGTSSATGSNSLAIGVNAWARAELTVAIGNGANAQGINSVAMGYISASAGAKSVGIGQEASSAGDRSLSIGHKSSAATVYATAIGHATTASGAQAQCFGSDSTASGSKSTAVGRGAIVSGTNSICVGTGGGQGGFLGVTGDHSVMLGGGVNSFAKADYGVCIGMTAKIDTSCDNSIAIGVYSSSSAKGQVVVGPHAYGSNLDGQMILGSPPVYVPVNKTSSRNISDAFVVGHAGHGNYSGPPNSNPPNPSAHEILKVSPTGILKARAGLILDVGDGSDTNNVDNNNGPAAGVTGTATIGIHADTDLLTLTSNSLTVAGSVHLTGSLSFEGSTADDFETTLAVTDPTADRTITFPDAQGTVCVTGGTGLTLTEAGTMNVDATQTQITAVGTIATGVWNGTAITDAYLATITTANKVSGSAVQLAGTSALEDSTGLQLKSAVAGSGLTLTSQVLSVDAAQSTITSLTNAGGVTLTGALVISGAAASTCAGAFNPASGTVTGAWTVNGALTAGSISCGGNAALTGNLTVDGNTTLGNSGGDTTTIRDNLAITDGSSNIFTVDSSGNVTCAGTLTATGGTTGAYSAATDGIAIGNGANKGTDADGNVAIGHDSVANQSTGTTSGSVAVGHGATTAAYQLSVAVGRDAQAKGLECVALGEGTRGNEKCVAVGSGCNISGAGTLNVAMGWDAQTIGSHNTVIGSKNSWSNNTPSLGYCTALGSYAHPRNNFCVSIGAGAVTGDTMVGQMVFGVSKVTGSNATVKNTNNTDPVIFSHSSDFSSMSNAAANAYELVTFSTAGQIKAKGGLVLDSQTSSSASAVIGTGSDANLMTLTDNTVTVAGAVNSSTVTTTSDVGVGGILTVTGATAINGGLNVESGVLTVANGGTGVGITGGLTVSSAVDINSTADISDTLTCSKASGTGLAVTKNATIGGNLAVSGNTVITGDLTVQGSTTQISSTQVTIEDPVFVVAKGSTSATQPRGIQMNYDKTGNADTGHAAFLFDDHRSKFVLANHWINGSSNFSADFGTNANNIYGVLDVGDINGKGDIAVADGKKVTTPQMQVASSTDSFTVTVTF